MSELVILVPVLDRPQRVAPFLAAVEKSTPQARVVFLTDPGDEREHHALDEHVRRSAVRCRVRYTGGTYAEKINRGVRWTKEPWIFLAADDLEPEPGWLEAALAAIDFDGPAVVGLNDLIPRRRRRAEHATHFLMNREYAEMPTIDGGPGPLYTGYSHWKVDDELIATATARGAYVYAPAARILHLHPMVQLAPDDATYRKGRANARRDRELFRERTPLWT